MSAAASFKALQNLVISSDSRNASRFVSQAACGRLKLEHPSPFLPPCSPRVGRRRMCIKFNGFRKGVLYGRMA
jgi:hypothetical protein